MFQRSVVGCCLFCILACTQVTSEVIYVLEGTRMTLTLRTSAHQKTFTHFPLQAHRYLSCSVTRDTRRTQSRSLSFDPTSFQNRGTTLRRLESERQLLTTLRVARHSADFQAVNSGGYKTCGKVYTAVAFVSSPTAEWTFSSLNISSEAKRGPALKLLCLWVSFIYLPTSIPG